MATGAVADEKSAKMSRLLLGLAGVWAVGWVGRTSLNRSKAAAGAAAGAAGAAATGWAAGAGGPKSRSNRFPDWAVATGLLGPLGGCGTRPEGAALCVGGGILVTNENKLCKSYPKGAAETGAPNKSTSGVLAAEARVTPSVL